MKEFEDFDQVICYLACVAPSKFVDLVIDVFGDDDLSLDDMWHMREQIIAEAFAEAMANSNVEYVDSETATCWGHQHE